MIQVSATYSLALSSREFTYDTLLHRKALLVIAAGNADNLSQFISMVFLSLLMWCSYVALPFISKRIGWHFVAHALLHEHTEFALIVELVELLRAVGRVGDVQLHLDGC